jgi:hypothetical protein
MKKNVFSLPQVFQDFVFDLFLVFFVVYLSSTVIDVLRPHYVSRYFSLDTLLHATVVLAALSLIRPAQAVVRKNISPQSVWTRIIPIGLSGSIFLWIFAKLLPQPVWLSRGGLFFSLVLLIGIGLFSLHDDES